MNTKILVAAAATLIVSSQIALGASLQQDTFPVAQSIDPLDIQRALQQQIPKGHRVVAMTTKHLDNQDYTYLKVMDTEGEVRTQILDSKGNSVPEYKLPKPVTSLFGDTLADILDGYLEHRYPADRPIMVNIALKQPLLEVTEPLQYGEDSLVKGNASVMLNGKPIAEHELQALRGEEQERLVQLREWRDENARNQMQELVERHGLMKRHGVSDALEEARSTLTVELDQEAIRELAEKSADLIEGIELYVAPKDDVADAMISTEVDPYALYYSAGQGDDIGIYMTESGCANAGHITNYRKIAGSRTNHSENVSGILRAVSPDSYVYCRGGATLPTSTDLNGYSGNPEVHIVTRSNGSGDNGNFTTTDRDWDNFVYNEAIPVFKSAGNNGDDNGYISSPGNGLNVTAVGNYNDSTDSIAADSSYKDPETGNDKPEISAPGTSITAGGRTMSGTSMSCPHAAAFAADMMSDSTWLQSRPHLVKAKMLSGAVNSITGGSSKVGLGGINYFSAFYNGTNSWWQGGNGSFSTFDSWDSNPNNSYIERQVTLSSSYPSVRIAMAWLNRGSYTYSHRNDSHPIGMDLDMRVYDPNGHYVGGSYSWDNPYESLTFNPSVSGTYTIKINRYANRDTSSKLHIGMSINW